MLISFAVLNKSLNKALNKSGRSCSNDDSRVLAAKRRRRNFFKINKNNEGENFSIRSTSPLSSMRLNAGELLKEGGMESREKEGETESREKKESDDQMRQRIEAELRERIEAEVRKKIEMEVKQSSREVNTASDIRLRAHEAFRFNVMVVGESGLGKSTFLREWVVFMCLCVYVFMSVCMRAGTMFKGFVEDVHRLVPLHRTSEDGEYTKPGRYTKPDE